MNDNQDILLSKWLQGSISSEELTLLKQKYNLEELKDILDAQQNYDLDIVPAEEMWEGFQHQQDLEQVEQLRSGKSFFALPIFIFLLILLGLGLVYFLKSDGIKTKRTEQQNYEFADGSKVIVGPESNLTFNESKWNEERRLELYGQAFFDVEKGKEFIVETNAGNIRVLGTEFDIWQIHNEFLRVQCYEGSVAVKANNQKEVVLKPGEEVRINKNILSDITSISENQSDWLDNQRQYKSLPAYLVLGDMSRFYGKKFTMPKSLENEVFSGYLPTNNLEDMVKKFAIPMSWKWEEVGGKYSFSEE